MNIKKFFYALGLSTLLIAGTSVFHGCTPMITDEQKAQLNNLRKQESDLNDDISKAKKDKAALEAELNSRKTEYNKCNETRELIKQRLANFPDGAWPDWKPEPPKQEEVK